MGGVSWSADRYEIDCAEPGHGRVRVYRHDPGGGAVGVIELAGAALGQTLLELSGFALTDDPAAPEVATVAHLPWPMTRGQARLLLRPFMLAVVAAGSGEERYERLFHDPDDTPAPPLCVRCYRGSREAHGEKIDSWCLDHPHAPFGAGGGVSWEAAEQAHAAAMRWHDWAASAPDDDPPPGT